MILNTRFRETRMPPTTLSRAQTFRCPSPWKGEARGPLGSDPTARFIVSFISLFGGITFSARAQGKAIAVSCSHVLIDQ